MKETICTIPINDIFMPKDGCPICRMESMLEEQYVKFITGDAMMVPDVRIETNKKGFCHRHFSQMFEKGQKLPNALILESHLQEIIDNYFPKKIKGKPDKKQLEAIKTELSSCYVCDRIKWDMKHFMATIFVEWAKGEEFRKLYNEQPYICLKHYSFIMETATAKDGIASKHLADFHTETATLTKKYLESLKADITHFCSMFDYRSQGQDWGTSKDSIERSIQFLTGLAPSGKEN
ncbi:MAG: DUF6062 family protein [Ruminococcus sp.]|nr:DUF6062 family protein [Ruminococcus sp.]